MRKTELPQKRREKQSTFRNPNMQKENPKSLHNTHIKLLAFNFLSLTPSFSSINPTTFHLKAIPISRIETVGTVTLRDFKPNRFLRFAIDDGTGCIPCILWLNHLTSPHLARRHNPNDLSLLADASFRSASLVNIGVVARVRGRITSFKGSLQITVSDVVLERDPNAEVLHWLDCINLARNCYNLDASFTSAPPN